MKKANVTSILLLLFCVCVNRFFSVNDCKGVLVLYKTAYVVCCVFWLYFHRYLLRNQRKLDNVVLHTDPKSTTLGPQLIFISKKPPFEPRPVSVFKAGENACKDCFWSFFFKTFIKILFQTANDNESTAINGNAYRNV